MEQHETNKGQSRPQSERQAGVKETGRIEAFSDGVFAVAITLLVLDLRLPDGATFTGDSGLYIALGHLWPKFLAFVVSFAFTGIMWINHHRLFTHIVRSDTVLMLLNLLLLFGVTIVQFPTVLVSEQLGGPAETAAAAVYNGLFVGIAIVFNVLWRYASSHDRLLSRGADRAAVRRITQQYVFGPVVYLAAFLLAFVNVPLSLLLDLLLAMFFALPGPPLTRQEKASGGPE